MVCVDDIWKVVDGVLGSLFAVGRYDFFLRRFSRAKVPVLEFHGVTGVLPHLDSFNISDFTFGTPHWRSEKLHINNGAVIHHIFLWWPLQWC